MMPDGACPSDFALERHLLNELPRSLSTITAHLAACDLCRAKVEAKRADNAAYFASEAANETRRALTCDPEATRRPALRTRRETSRRLLIAVGATAMVAIVHRHYAQREPHADRVHDEEQDVLRIQNEWMQAVRDDDDIALDRILADDYTYTDSRGAVSTKADSLRLARAKRSGMTSFRTSDTKTSLHGDLAVITGRLTVEGVNRGEHYQAEVRFTDILARIDGRWRAVAAHASRPGDSAKKE